VGIGRPRPGPDRIPAVRVAPNGRDSPPGRGQARPFARSRTGATVRAGPDCRVAVRARDRRRGGGRPRPIDRSRSGRPRPTGRRLRRPGRAAFGRTAGRPHGHTAGRPRPSRPGSKAFLLPPPLGEFDFA